MKLSEMIYLKDTVIHCMTEKDAKKLCSELNKLGMTWPSGKSFKSYTNYKHFQENSCYYPLRGTCDSLIYFMKKSFKIIPFSEIEFGEEDNVKPVKISAPNRTKPHTINWEQRRYEITKDVLGHLVARDGMASEYELNIERAIKYADELINKLKK